MTGYQTPAQRSARYPGMEVRVYGKPHNWNLSDLRQHSDLNTPNGKKTFDQLRYTCQTVGVHRILAPIPSRFNATVIEAHELSEEISEEEFRLYRGCFADGVVIPERTGFFLGSADCPTIVAWLRNFNCGRIKRLVAAHAGRDCLLCPSVVRSGHLDRTHFSVVDAVMEKVSETEAADLNVMVVCGIGAKQFTHRPDHYRWGAWNQQLISFLLNNYGRTVFWNDDPSYGQLDLFELIRLQFESHGVNNVLSDGLNTFLGRDSQGRMLWHSHARSSQSGEPEGRNGILVARTL